MTIPIYFATMTGNCRDLAERAGRLLNARGFAAEARDLVREKPDGLRDQVIALFIISTWGDGEPPDDAFEYVTRLESSDPLELSGLEFSVCALGDTNYDAFCGCGKIVDARLEAHGARRLVRRVDCDVDYEDLFQTWLDAVIDALERRALTV